jgi:Tfp pilus assembly protein PilF
VRQFDRIALVDRFVLVLMLALLAGGGCGRSGKQLEQVRVDANQRFREATDAFESKDYATAATKFDEVVENGGVNADLYVIAMLKRSLAWAATGNFDQAHAGLDELEAGAPDLDQILAARSTVFAQQGKTSEARAALAKAKRINRRIRAFQL